jgi:hypothetical protein
MKYALLFSAFSFVVAGISHQQTNLQKLATEAPATFKQLRPQLLNRVLPIQHFGSNEPIMQEAWYEYGTSQAAPPAIAKKGFTVAINSAAIATDFVSSYEQWLRQHSIATADTAYLYYTSPWKEMTRSQRRIGIVRQREAYRRQADSLYAVNNRKHALIWLLNNSTEPVVLGTQDGSVFCVLQALDNTQQWRPVQYWHYSGCGNSYIARYLRPKETLALSAQTTTTGDFKTKLRYKLAGIKEFYYSNEFEGRISYSEFAEPPGRYGRSMTGQRVATFKLDSLPKFFSVGRRAFPFHQGGKWGDSLPY